MGDVGSLAQLELPVLPLRDVVAFPHATRPIQVARPRSTRLVEALPKDDADRVVALVLQRRPSDEDPGIGDLFRTGTLARILRVDPVRRGGAGYVLLAAGVQRIRILHEVRREPHLVARVEVLAEQPPAIEDSEYKALRDGLRRLFTEFVNRSHSIPDEVMRFIGDLDDGALLSDVVSATMPTLTNATRQQLLATIDVRERLRTLIEELVKDNERNEIEDRIESQIRDRVAGAQREFLLREQLRAIRHELGEEEAERDDADELKQRLDDAGLPDEVRKDAMRELARLRQVPPISPEHTVIRTRLDWLAALPWRKSTGTPVDLAAAERILDEDHFGLDKVKRRILEHLAVMQLRKEARGPILCFVGPPGVGKTSLGRSIARSLGRSFARLSLGGVHDEAELRGHRRTYIGAMPGQIIQAMRRAGSNDPVLMLDEIDKLGHDFRGDPAAALLEVLDPEQNNSFRDHYLDVPFDLSKVLFVATANVLDPVPAPLLDRMEILELSGYSEAEKLQIARRYLVPKQVEGSGLDGEAHLRFSDEGLLEVARHYTREAGVRNLEREIGAICRRQARRIASGNAEPELLVTPGVVRNELGPVRFRVECELEQRTEEPGVAVGLAWTPAGGDLLFIEASRVPEGRGQLTLTGHLGDVMQESARAALTWIRAHASQLGVRGSDLKDSDLHVHVPAGGVPKDGPSAGVVIVTAIVSALTGHRVRSDLAMTGEITLSGVVLPVGGIREKVLAARRSGVRELILPELNEPELMHDVPADLREGIVFSFVRTIDDVLARAFAGPLPILRRSRPPAAPEPAPPPS